MRAKFRSTKGGIKISARFDHGLDRADHLFITNANKHENSTLEIAAIYKKLWEVEPCFKNMKQNLHIKRFYGQGENAVKTQIWIALIVHLLFLILTAMTRQNNRTFSSFCPEISVVLFKHGNLEKWFSRGQEKSPPPDKNSLWLFDGMA